MTAPAAAGFVEPAYQQRSLGDVLPAVARALGVPAGRVGVTPSGLVLPDAPAYVVFLIDGLGAQLLRRYAHTAPFLAGLLEGSAVGTAGVPSTTATSLTSFGTGLTPGTHGMVGFTSRVPGTDELLNALFWDADVDPLQWQPHKTAFAQLVAAGVHTTNVNKADFERSGLTLAAHRGARYVGADLADERLAAVLASLGDGPSVTYMYDADLDRTGHFHGVASQEWLQELAAIDAEAERVREALPPSVRLVIVADHGMVDSPPDRRLDVDEEPDLRSGVTLVGGEARFRHLYCRSGAVSDVVATWRDRLGSDAEVLTRDEAAARGWFGPIEVAVRPRIGDVVVACRNDFAVLASAQFPYEGLLVGLHGSLTPDEMLIPLLVC